MCHKLTINRSTCQTKDQKRLYLRGKGYSVSKLDHNKAVAERQRALKLANLNNLVGPLLSPLSGIRNRNRLKVLIFLINTSTNYFNRISHRRISYALGIDIRTSKRCVKYLKEQGYIVLLLENNKYNRDRLIPNMYIISDIFKDKTLMNQLKNMYYETKDAKKPIKEEEEFGVTHIRYIRKIINNNSFSRTKTNQDNSSLVLECLFSGGCSYEEFVSRRERPKRGMDLVGKCIKTKSKLQISASMSNEAIEIKISPKNDMISYLDQFKKDIVNDA